MSRTPLCHLVVLLILVVSFAGVRGADLTTRPAALLARPVRGSAPVAAAGAREETLWIFDADFEDLAGDNADWTTYDVSGTVGQANHWHHDTIRINGFEHLGDSTWWCGTYNDCWRQPRGYGNNWLQILERRFTEASDSTGTMVLEYDQRYAIEHCYDYGYVDIRSPAHPDSWVTIVAVHNPGFAGTPGVSQDWDDIDPYGPGHMVVNISDYVGDWFDLRFRLESDIAGSSQDSHDSPPASPFRDGAWQLDNITLLVNGHAVFYDDAEGDDPWTHEDIPSSGQTGVTFWRGRYGIDFVTGRAFACDEPPIGSWMYAPVDPFTSTMVDEEHAWLMSPPIDISGAQRLVTRMEFWTDCEAPTHDLFNMCLATSDLASCVLQPDSFVDEEPGWWYHGPHWWCFSDDWDAFCGSNWLAILWAVLNDEPAEEPHMGGVFVDRHRVGIPSGDPGTIWEHDYSLALCDWFVDDLAEALAYRGEVEIRDDDGVVSARLVASNDGRGAWESYEMERESAGGSRWLVPAPANQMTPASEIRYYYEATDGIGNTSIYPPDAPDGTFEMSILPIEGSVSDPGVLLVDKSGSGTPGAMRRGPPYLVGGELGIVNPNIAVELYYREMLESLGHEYDIFDVRSGGETTHASDGPDTTGMKYYDTQVWFTSDLESQTINRVDQLNLIRWLNESSEGKDRNLLLTGNTIGWELVEDGAETLGFYWTWLASDYLDDAVGVVTVDSVPGLEDRSGDWAFMTHADSECILRGGCPLLHGFDVVEPVSGVVGAERVADYVRMDATRRSAGVAYTHPTMGYQTVTLGFAMECMMDGTAGGGAANYTPEGYYHSGSLDRQDLMRNIMDYFGKAPSGAATGVVDAECADALSHAHPNPFNPVTRIAYSVEEAGRVSIRVHNVAGRTVRTLLDAQLPAGASGYVAWDGTGDAGERCASGVYFCRITAPGFKSSRKMVLLK